jgi:magnesium chelatase family protein
MYGFLGGLSMRARISGPLLDRIDLQIEVPALRENELSEAASGETSMAIRARVEQARQRQMARQDKPNAQLGPAEIEVHCTPDAAGAALLKQAAAHLDLSARAYHRILKVARTIADLAGASGVAAVHVAEAVQYRRLRAGT